MPARVRELKRQIPLIRNFQAGQQLEVFLVSAVSAVLAIRFFLQLTHYPQVGGSTLHIAHMLWGGLLMLAALVLLLSFLGRRSQQLAALLGGLGFGTFIDEVGKFVTQDNDYFYRPAVALIYVVFVLTYLAARTLHRRGEPTADEYLINALQEMENVVLDDLDREERDRALRYLACVAPDDAVAAALRRLLERQDLVPASPPPWFVRLRRLALRLYTFLSRLPGFSRVVVGFFVLQLAVKLAHVTALALDYPTGFGFLSQLPSLTRLSAGLSLSEWLQLGSAALSGLFVLWGIVQMPRSRLQAFRMFQRSILVSIFLTQVFMFYLHQWAALVALAFNLLVLPALNFMIERERGLSAAPPRAAPAPAPGEGLHHAAR